MIPLQGILLGDTKIQKRRRDHDGLGFSRKKKFPFGFECSLVEPFLLKKQEISDCQVVCRLECKAETNYDVKAYTKGIKG